MDHTIHAMRFIKGYVAIPKEPLDIDNDHVIIEEE